MTRPLLCYACDEFARNGQRIQAMADLRRPYHQDAGPVLEAAFKRSDRVHVTEQDGESAIVMFAKGQAPLGNGRSFYIGLLARHERLGQPQDVHRTILRMRSDAREVQRRTGRPLTVFMMTANARAVKLLRTYFDDVEPTPFGSVADVGLDVLSDSRRFYGASPLSRPAPPFVLRGVSPYRYRPEAH